MNRTLADIWRWKRSSRAASWPSHVPCPPVEAHRLSAPADRAFALWINHATVLWSLAGKWVLTDPQFSAAAGPFGRWGPKRVHPPALALERLPPLTAILLTHDHYDHCDVPSLRRLARTADQPKLVTPLGNGALARRAGFRSDRIVELDWWDEYRLDDQLTVTATPARHWSNRLSGRRNARLWSGFFLRAGERSGYAVGDTGYDDVMFQDVRRRLGAPDLAALPIGAYEPRWFMAAQHCNPEEAVRIHQDLGARVSFGVHWGTFQLTDEAREAPAQALLDARAAAGVAPSAFPLLQPGETIVV